MRLIETEKERGEEKKEGEEDNTGVPCMVHVITREANYWRQKEWIELAFNGESLEQESAVCANKCFDRSRLIYDSNSLMATFPLTVGQYEKTGGNKRKREVRASNKTKQKKKS